MSKHEDQLGLGARTAPIAPQDDDGQPLTAAPGERPPSGDATSVTHGEGEATLIDRPGAPPPIPPLASTELTKQLSLADLELMVEQESGAELLNDADVVLSESTPEIPVERLPAVTPAVVKSPAAAPPPKPKETPSPTSPRRTPAQTRPLGLNTPEPEPTTTNQSQRAATRTPPSKEPRRATETIRSRAMPQQDQPHRAAPESGQDGLSSATEVDWRSELEFYLRECDASAAHQPQRAAAMSVAAAMAADLAAQDSYEELQRALTLASEDPGLVPLIRELFLLARRFDEALELSSAQLKLGNDNNQRIAALLDACAIERFRRRDLERGLRLARQALDLQPGHPIALTFTSTLVQELRHERQSAKTLEQLADVVVAPLERASLCFAAGTLQEFLLGDDEQAAHDYRLATETDPLHVPALLALKSLQERTRDWEGLCVTLEHLAESPLAEQERAHYLMQAGTILLARLDNKDGAARAFEGASGLAPHDVSPLSRLAHLYDATSRHDALVDVLQRRLQSTPDEHGRADILTTIGWIAEARLNEEERAITAYRQALEQRPGYMPAVRGLQRLYRRRGDIEALLEILHQLAEGSAAEADRALVCVEAAELLLRQQGRANDAATFLQRALDLDPQLTLAFWPLRRLLRREQRFWELAQLIEHQLEQLQQSPARGPLLLELARLQAGPLGQAERAIETLKRAGESDLAGAASIELADVYALQQRHAELSALLLRQADEATTAEEAISCRLQAARSLDADQAEYEQAVQIYKAVLKQNESNYVARSALTELYSRLGKWEQLTALLRDRAKNEPACADTAQLWCTIGQLTEQKLGQSADAIAAFRAALLMDPAQSDALVALERLLLDEGRYDDLVEMLSKHAQACLEPSAAADAYSRAADVADCYGNNLQQAEELLRRALQRHETNATVLRSLYALQCRREAYGPAAETLERLISYTGEGMERAALLLQLARLREHRLNQPADPQLLEDVSVGDLAPRLRLERLRAARATLDPEQTASLLLETGRSASDAGLAAALLLEAAYRFEISGNTDRWLEAASAAAERLPQEPAIVSSVRRSHHGAERWSQLAQAWTDQAATAEPRAAQVMLLRAAIMHLRGKKRGDAVRTLARSVEKDPQDVAALRLRGALANASGDWTTLAKCLDQLALLCASPRNRLAAALQAAEVWHGRLDDRAHALSSLMTALRQQPDHAEAFVSAAQLLEALGRHGDLAQLQAYHIEHVQDQQTKVSLLREHARLLRQQLQNPAAAVEALARLLRWAPGDIQALRDSVELLVGLRRWADADRVLQSLAHHANAPELAREARLQRARICFEQLQAPEQARQSLHEILKSDASDIEAKRLLVRIDLAEGQWARARELLEQLAAEGDARLAVWAMCGLAEVAQSGFHDEAQRERWEREALGRAAQSEGALAELVERFRKQGQAGALANMVESLLRETTSAAAASALRITLAALLVEDLQQPDRSLEQLRECLVTDPRNTQAHLLQAQALEQQGDGEAAMRSYRRLLSYDTSCAPAYRGMLRLAPRQGATATAGSAASLLDLMGQASATEQAEIETLENTGTPAGTLSRLEMEGDRELGATREVLELVAPHLGSLYRLPLSHEGTAPEAARTAAGQLARALGLSGVKLSLEGTAPAVAGTGQPVLLHVSPQLAATPRHGAFRFWVGRAIASTTTAGALLLQLSDAELTELVEALCTDHPIDPTIAQLRKRALRALPRKTRKQIELIASPKHDPTLWSRYRAIEVARADRAGLLLSGSPRTALSELARHEGAADNPTGAERVADLMRFAVSEEYERHHRSLWSTATT